MIVDVVAPETRSSPLDQELEALRRLPNSRPFSPPILDFCAEFSAALQRDSEAQRYPELKVLAFYMRRAALVELQRSFEKLDTDPCILVPRGMVFHIPPANVDTIFLYSWLLAALTGNRNIIRLSARESPQTSILLRIFSEVTRSKADPQVRSATLMLRYGHDRAVTEAISAVADVRVIWGGDRTVGEIRSVPIPPHAREVTFPDRFSLAIVKASAWLASAEPQRAALAERFYNDTYWFDQAGCSSPRLLIWVGSQDEAAKSSRAFAEALQSQIASRGYRLATGAYLNKLAFACGAIADGGVASYESPSSELSLLTLDNLQALRRDHCGGGLLFQASVEQLAGLAEFIDRRDQTATHFGFTEAELLAFARTLNGRGIDRMVPIGEALTFHRYWDGYDLLQELTRRVFVSTRTLA